MRNIFFALIFSVFLFNTAWAAADLSRYSDECRSFIKHPQIQLLSSYGNLKYRFDKDSDFLKKETAKRFSEQHVDVPDNFMPIGLTKVQDIFDFDFTAGTMGLSHGYTCVFPETMKAKLAYSLPTIYILNSLKKDSCEYNLALQHEKTHMQIYIEALDYFLPELKKYLEQLFDEIGFVVVARGESLDKAAKELNEKYLEKVQEKIDFWLKEREAEQLKLDMPEQYLLENLICEYLENKQN